MFCLAPVDVVLSLLELTAIDCLSCPTSVVLDDSYRIYMASQTREHEAILPWKRFKRPHVETRSTDYSRHCYTSSTGCWQSAHRSKVQPSDSCWMTWRCSQAARQQAFFYAEACDQCTCTGVGNIQCAFSSKWTEKTM